jgi:hypothetical protein
MTLVRRGDFGLIGAVGWWGFDIAVLWAASKPSAIHHRWP